MKYFVQGTNLEALAQKEIEAETAEEAEDKYYKLWDAGMIEVVDSEVSIDKISTNASITTDLPDVIEISWHIDDVKGMDGYEDMTDNEAREVLQRVHNNHDATIGVNWDTLAYHADEVKAKRK